MMMAIVFLGKWGLGGREGVWAGRVRDGRLGRSVANTTFNSSPYISGGVS
jgi:hypothetical protein